MRRVIDEAVFHITPDESSGAHDSIPFARAMEIMQGLMSIVSGLADAHMGDDTDSRSVLRPTEDAQEHYQLFLKPAQVGCYAMAVELVDTRDSEQNTTPLFDDYEVTFTDVGNIFDLVSNNSINEFRQKCRSHVVAEKILDGVEKIAPTNGEILYLNTTRRGTSRRTPIRREARRNIVQFRAEPNEPETVELYGTVAEVDFENQQLRVKLNGSGKKLFVGYSQELEERTLHEVRNEQQKLTCTVAFTPNGAIEKIESIDKMSVLVLRTIEVSSFDIDDRTIRFKEPIRFQEQLDADAGSMIYVEYPDLGLMVFAEFQDDMEELILEELANKWEWIVESDDDELTKDALEIKRRFLTIAEEG